MRDHVITVRVTKEEQAMANELAAAEDVPTGRLVRRMLRELYTLRFGEAAKTTAKRGRR
jgi:hypothetical protein